MRSVLRVLAAISTPLFSFVSFTITLVLVSRLDAPFPVRVIGAIPWVWLGVDALRALRVAVRELRASPTSEKV